MKPVNTLQRLFAFPPDIRGSATRSEFTVGLFLAIAITVAIGGVVLFLGWQGIPTNELSSKTARGLADSTTVTAVGVVVHFLMFAVLVQVWLLGIPGLVVRRMRNAGLPLYGLLLVSVAVLVLSLYQTWTLLVFALALFIIPKNQGGFKVD